MTKKTCLYDTHVKYGGKIVDFAGFEMPIQYEGILQEHMATRNAIGLFDVSHMGKFTVTGSDSREFINQLITNDLSPVVNNQIIYSPMCYNNGGTIDDLLVYQHDVANYLLVVNAGNKDKDYKWIEEQLDGDVILKDITDNLCQLAVQGPHSVSFLESLCDVNLQDIPYYEFKDHVILAGVSMLVSRTGYTGEDGFELYFDQSKAGEIWDILISKGSDYGIKPCGLGARDTLRFEAGMPLYGNELGEDINPIEVGLQYFVKLKKGDFIGKEALIQAKANPKRKLIGFELKDKGIARHGSVVVDDKNTTIGTVTTGYKSPSFDATIGLALIDASYDSSTIYIQVRNKVLEAFEIPKRFIKTYGKDVKTK